MPSLTKAKQAQQEEARADLREMLKPGDTVYVLQRHVSRSGMMRHLSLFIVRGGKPLDITRRAADAMGERLYTDNSRYLKVGGAGMDMHFAIVYALSRALYPQGHRCIGEYGCPSNDHSNDYGTASRLFYDRLDEQGRERFYDMETEEARTQEDERRAFIAEQLAGPLGYRKTRMHSDGGYALTYSTL